ncbi:MAG: DPP IV N-terminal domain-containing protein, partial [Flavobacteriales bacterium]|nr:DPP IV N-terminal domain-containing protein [Flavobacteriales bacterium]
MKSFNIFLCLFLSTIVCIGQGKELSNELIWNSRTFSSNYVYGLRSMNDGLHYTTLERSAENGSEIVQYRYEDGGKVRIIASSKSIFNDPGKRIEDYEFSADELQLLITTDQERIYRRSRKANYYVHSLEKGKTFPLTDFSNGKQRLAEFSPDGSMIAFVRDNNIFTLDVKYREETQVTYDGVSNQIINGATDWVYEEEFGFAKGFYWSPKGDKIAYYKFDESAEKQFQM